MELSRETTTARFISLLDLSQPPYDEHQLKEFLRQKTAEFKSYDAGVAHSQAQSVLRRLRERGFHVQIGPRSAQSSSSNTRSSRTDRSTRSSTALSSDSSELLQLSSHSLDLTSFSPDLPSDSSEPLEISSWSQDLTPFERHLLSDSSEPLEISSPSRDLTPFERDILSDSSEPLKISSQSWDFPSFSPDLPSDSSEPLKISSRSRDLTLFERHLLSDSSEPLSISSPSRSPTPFSAELLSSSIDLIRSCSPARDPAPVFSQLSRTSNVSQVPGSFKYKNFQNTTLAFKIKKIGQQLVERHRLHSHQTWLVDCEFFVLAQGKEFIPMQLSVRDMNGKQLLFCKISYNMNRKEFCEALQGFINRKDATPQGRETNYLRLRHAFHKFYATDDPDLDQSRTYGLTVPQIRDKLLQCGWTPKHLLISYCAGHDISIMNKIMSGETSLVTTTIPAKNRLNIMGLAKAVLPTLPSYRLPDLHQHFYPKGRGDKRRYHNADWDTAALHEVIVKLIQDRPPSC